MSLLPTTKFKVRIICSTYNHASYIEDSMNGFCMQKTSFPYVAIIVDDASTDGEPEIIRNYLDNNFDMVNARHDENDDAIITAAIHKDNPNCHFLVIFLKYNFYSIKKARAYLYKGWYEDVPYVAICEGDDYWKDPYKLQKQVNILEKYDECGFVYTGCARYIQKTGTYTSSSDHLGSFDDLLLENFIHTPTVLYRMQLKQSYDKEIFPYAQNWLMGDYPLWLYLSAISQPGFIPEITSVYRVLKESASHSHDYNKNFIFIKSIFEIRTFFAQHYHREYKLTDIAHSFVTKEVRLSIDLKHKLQENLLPYMFKYRVFDIKLGILCFLLLSSCGINIVNHIISKKCLV